MLNELVSTEAEPVIFDDYAVRVWLYEYIHPGRICIV